MPPFLPAFAISGLIVVGAKLATDGSVGPHLLPGRADPLRFKIVPIFSKIFCGFGNFEQN